jgi:hypothetical protein|tara:strand:+ start:184 stop:564 length:381 start_codon:yes stop_codon:yes gene_type:complete
VSDIEDLGSIKLTDRQIQRQVKKLKKLLFENYEEYEDGTYKGEVITEISDIISKYIGPEEEISQIKLLETIQLCAIEVFEWCSGKIIGVDNRLMALYCFDFVNQSFNSFYSIKEPEDDDSDNMMYL